MADLSNVTTPTRRRLPGTRWSAIHVNWRWIVQAVALIAGIYFFKRAFENSKSLVSNFSVDTILVWSIWVLLFALCFFALMFTSYLKERGSGTLRHRIAIFEKLVALFHLENYSENVGQTASLSLGHSSLADAQTSMDNCSKSGNERQPPV